MGISNFTGKWLKNIKDLAVSDHLLQGNCTINFDHFDILAFDVSKFFLLVKQSLLMKHDNLVFNPLSANPTKWSNTLKQFVGKFEFDHFVGLALKGLRKQVRHTF